MKETENITNFWEERLKEYNYRLTRPRKIILEILLGTGEHLCAEEIYQQVYREYPAIGLTTVYRTLELFVQLGLILKFDFGDGRTRYELHEGSHVKKGHHHHLVCTSCHRVIDYNDFVDEELELLKKTEKALEEKYQFHITNHIIAFYGLCKECQRKKKLQPEEINDDTTQG